MSHGLTLRELDPSPTSVSTFRSTPPRLRPSARRRGSSHVHISLLRTLFRYPFFFHSTGPPIFTRRPAIRLPWLLHRPHLRTGRISASQVTLTRPPILRSARPAQAGAFRASARWATLLRCAS